MRETERNKQAISAFIDVVWRVGELSRLAEFWTADCRNHAAPAGHDRGLPALADYHAQFATAFAAFAELDIAIEQQVAEGDRVVTQLLTTALHVAPFFGAAATNKRVALASMRIDRLVEGKIAEHWSVADMAGLMGQITG